MCAALRHRSRSEQKAVFANLASRLKKANSYNAFSDEVDSEFRIKSKEADSEFATLVITRLKEPIGSDIKRLDEEYKKDLPSGFNFIFSRDLDYIPDIKKKRFSDGSGDGYYDDDELTTTLL
jgi:hypothetical protein